MRQGDLHHLLAHTVGNAIPELPGLRRAVFQSVIACFQIAFISVVEGAAWNVQLCQCLLDRQRRLFHHADKFQLFAC
jgi:hypothetical protein